jgi:hypothetical protein
MIGCGEVFDAPMLLPGLGVPGRGATPLAAVETKVDLNAGVKVSCSPEQRLRILIETDAGGDPDDEQSLVRLLTSGTSKASSPTDRLLGKKRMSNGPDWASSKPSSGLMPSVIRISRNTTPGTHRPSSFGPELLLATKIETKV